MPNRVLNRLDPLVSAFQADSGATDVAGLDALIKYVRAESLLSSSRIYPMKSAQNAGSGATVYGVGSLTATNMTLANGPAWGPTGITLNGTTQYGQALNTGATYNAGNQMTVFSRFAFATESNTDVFSSTNPRYLFSWLNGDDVVASTFLARVVGGKPDMAYRNAADTAFVGRTQGNAHSIDTSMQTVVWQSDATNSRLFINKTETGYDIQNATESSIATGDDWYFGTQDTTERFADATMAATLIVTAPLTTTQRETITDLVNAL